MSSGRWMLYGAYGYSGTLIAEEAVRRGHRPVLAGRSADKLRALADRLGLEQVAFDLGDRAATDRALQGIQLLFNAAGPFERTSEPLVQACLAHRVHYLDITGEVAVFETNFGHDSAARAAGITLMSGVGFDVVPTDCAARYVAELVPDATTLELGFTILGGASGGTLATTLEQIPRGALVRTNGELTVVPLGRGRRRIRFADRERTGLPVPWGDVATAYRTTSIPNITVYMGFSRVSAALMTIALPVARQLMRVGLLRRGLQKLIARISRGPSERALARSRSQVWARATNDHGRGSEVCLELPGSYPFTASAGLLIVDRVLASAPLGATTPARAFGADFVLEVPGVRRVEPAQVAA